MSGNYRTGEAVSVAVLWPHDMSRVWVSGFEVLADDGGPFVYVKGPDGDERTAHRDRVRRSSAPFLTSYCNRYHDEDGRPIDHECYRLPPGAIAMERAGNYQRAVELIDADKPLRRHTGTREPKR